MRTHDGKEVSQEDLNIARMYVAEFFRQNARAVREKDQYAKHVPEDEKDEILKRALIWADAVEDGEHDHNFTVWQRMNYLLTGECVALLP